MSIPFIRDAGFNYAPGDTVPVFENSSARVGHAVFVTDTARQMTNSVNKLRQMLGSEFIC